MDSIVFKVKYEETLRRFNVAVNGGQRLDLSMEGLRLKICSLFGFASDADFRLTYKDEDDDLVTLVDDNDLDDVVRQGLDPVRITVHLNSDQSSRSSSSPSGSAAPSTPSPETVQANVAEVVKSVQETLNHVLQSSNLQQSTNPDVAKILKSVQVPLAQAFSKLSSDMSSKAASSTSPIVAEIFDGLSKMGQSYASAAFFNTGANTESRPNNVDTGSMNNSADEGIRSDINKADPATGAHMSTQATEVDASVKYPPCPSPSPSPSLGKGEKVNCESSSHRKCSSRGLKNSAQQNGTRLNADFWRTVPRNVEKEMVNDALERMRSFRSFRGPVPQGTPPFGVPSAHDHFKQTYPSNGSLSKADCLGPIFHKGVRCDGCGVLPITGPRYKSKVKYDYDLCSVCFSRMGNSVDYTKIDLPLPRGHILSLKPDVSLRQCVMRPHVSKHLRSRLDSRFIMDVNVMDGTTMAPLTPFTKIWRMRNNGTLPWNGGLQLLWIGGDRFSPSDSVEIQVPYTGVEIGHELDIAVDFIAPELPGRYISYWRMAESSGHKFGQRVWVQIQVDPSEDLTRESSPMLNLNLPPESNETVFPEVVDERAEPELIIEVGEPKAPSAPEQKEEIGTVTLNFPTNDDLLIDGDVAPSSVTHPVADEDVAGNPAQEADTSLLPYPVIAELGESSSSSPAVPVDTSNIGASDESKSEEKMLKELAQMGFKQVDLNKEVLRMNEYDLDKSVDDLCDVSEWDPILEELKEMGFEDKETNKKLLAKNNGSITRVVMDLIADEKA
ncbi:hypothetical protein vseg_013935 [Gypsophila vaccaria]